MREFTPDDWRDLLAYHRDPRYLRFYPDARGTEADVRRLIERFLAWQQEEPRCRFQWAAVLPSSGELIGNCGIRKATVEAYEAEIGFELSPEYWGNGYATELAASLLWFGFDELGLHRIGAHCVAGNLASARVLEKVGMLREGRLRESQRIRGEWHDVLLYGILEADWRSVQRVDERNTATGS